MELYPPLQVKVLYQRDYVHLMVKHGLEEPSQVAGYEPGESAVESAESLLGLGSLAPPPGSWSDDR
jgi:hypothetical protein